MEKYQAKLATPFAVLGVVTDDDRLAAIDFLPLTTAILPPQSKFAHEVCRQLERYLREPAFHFTLPLMLQGTAFQRRVWDALVTIPSGTAVTYSELAQRVGSGARAVANACGANAIPVVIPCHRVVARHGIGGFMRGHKASSLSIKQWLLAHEKC